MKLKTVLENESQMGLDRTIHTQNDSGNSASENKKFTHHLLIDDMIRNFFIEKKKKKRVLHRKTSFSSHENECLMLSCDNR